MIKFILHGGKSRIDCENNRQFYHEIIDIPAKEVNLLVVSFAKPKEAWDLPKEEIAKIRATSDKKINIKTASKEHFMDELAWADSVYIRGGDCLPLMNELKKYENLGKLFQNKVIAGSSAGVCILSKYYYDNDIDSIDEGLSIIPIKAITHFGENNSYSKDFSPNLDDLIKHKEVLETIVLKETEFVVKEIDAIHDVSLLIIYDEFGRIILQDRRSRSKVGEEWGFFGGHIEVGETKEETLEREIKEELDIKISNYEYIGQVNTLINGKAINHRVFIMPIGDYEDKFIISDEGGYKKHSLEDVKKLKMVPGDQAVLDLIEQYMNERNIK